MFGLARTNNHGADILILGRPCESELSCRTVERLSDSGERLDFGEFGLASRLKKFVGVFFDEGNRSVGGEARIGRDDAGVVFT